MPQDYLKNFLLSANLKAVFVCIFSFALIQLNAQDEYERKQPVETNTPIDVKKDSIDVSDPRAKKTEEKKSDNSKAYQGMSDFKRNLRIGGAFNLGSYYYRSSIYDGQLFFIMISPQITQVLSEYFEGGISTSYSYTGSFGNINSHSLSAGPVLRAYPIPELFFQVEGVAYYNSQKIAGYPSYTTTNFNAFLGGGVVSRFSQTSYLLTGVKINLLKNELTYNQIIPTAFTSIHFGLW